MGDFVFKGLPSDLVSRTSDDGYGLITADGVLNKSKSYLFTGDITNYTLITPSVGNFLIIKGITIIGDGVSGAIKLFRSSNNQCILPCFMSSHNSASTSNSLNLRLNVNESLYISTTGRGALESFVGVSYKEMNPETIF